MDRELRGAEDRRWISSSSSLISGFSKKISSQGYSEFVGLDATDTGHLLIHKISRTKLNMPSAGRDDRGTSSTQMATPSTQMATPSTQMVQMISSGQMTTPSTRKTPPRNISQLPTEIPKIVVVPNSE